MKGVRSEVQMAKVEEEVEEEDVSKVKKSNKEVEEDIKEVVKDDNEVYKNIKEVDGDNKEMVNEAKVMPSKGLKEDIVRVKMESIGDVHSVKESDQDIVREIIQDMVRIATEVKVDLSEMEL